MPPHRVCSECPNSLKGRGPTAKTCSTKCRAARSRRIKAARIKAAEEGGKPLSEHQKDITERVRNEAPDVAHKIIEEEIRPVVRENITADTLEAIRKMVGLTGEAVAAIANDLGSDDPVIRQRAYTLIMKYTVGHQAIVRPPEEDKSQPLTVNFNLPRPGDQDSADENVEDAVEMRECDACGTEKRVTEFVANSSRCQSCYESQQNRAAELLNESD